MVKGDRVAIVMRNLPEWPVAFYAASSLGAIVTPLNAWWTGPELEYGLTDSGTKICVVDVERFDRLAEHFPNCPDLQHVFVSRMVDEVAHPFVSKLEDAIGGPNDWAKLPDTALPTTPIDADDDATIFYTSGTTGKPKGALATHRNVNSNIFSALWRRRAGLPAPGAKRRLRPIPPCRRRAACSACRSSTPPAASRCSTRPSTPAPSWP